MKRNVILLAALVLSVPVPAAGQQRPDTVRLRDLIVTATRLDTLIGDAPGSVTVIAGNDMREDGHRFLIDALRTAPGISIARSAGPGAQTSLFIRGGESDYVQVLVDGIQANDPGGAFNWAHMRTEDIERVEIVRGPASVLYGSDAVSGVIQIFTRSGGTPRIEAGVNSSRGSAMSGSFDTHAIDASLTGRTSIAAGGTSVLRYGVSAAHATSTGLFAYNSDYDNTNVSGRIRLEALRGDIALTARAADNEYHYPTSGSGEIVDPNQFATGATRSIGIDAGYDLLRSVELRVLGTLHSFDSRTDDPPDSDIDGVFWNTTDQLRRSLDGRINIDLPRSSVFTVGVEREWQEAQTAFESVSGGSTFADETDDSRTNTGLYAQLHGAPVERLSVTIGGRLDDNQAFGTFLTGRAAASWRANGNVRLHASVGTAFKEPTFFENFATGFTRGNPDLEPERARSWEAGIEIAALPFTLGATWFDQSFRNLIQYTFATPDPEAPNYFNVGAARAHGAELTVSIESGDVRASAGYTYTRTRVSNDGFGADPAFENGRQLLRRPRHQASLTTAARLTSALDATMTARWVGERDDLDFTDPVEFSGIRTTLDDYAVVDAGIRYSLLDRIDLSLSVNNVFDAEYAEIYNFPTPGRVVQVGVRAGIGL